MPENDLDIKQDVEEIKRFYAERIEHRPLLKALLRQLINEAPNELKPFYLEVRRYVEGG